MRVLHISNYPPRKGGISIWLEKLIEEMRNQDEEVSHEIAGFQDSEGKGVKPVIDKSSRKSFDEVLELIKSGNYDVVYIQHELNLFGRLNFLYFAGKLALWKMLSKSDTKIVTSIHTHIQYPLSIDPKGLAKYVGYRKLTYGVIQKYSDKIILFDKYAEQKTKLKNVEFIPLGAEVPESSDNIRNDLGVSDDDIVIGCAGFLEEGKNFHKIIEAMKHLPEKYKLVINGSDHPDYENCDGYYGRLQSIVKEESLENQVNLQRGFLSDEEMKNFLSSSDLTIIAYDEDNNQSGNMYRAIANNTKIICSDKQNYRAILGETASYFWPITPENIAEAIKRHEEIENTEELREMYSLENSARKHLDLFRELSQS